MANTATILSKIATLSQYQQEELLSHLEEYPVLGAQAGQVTKELIFSKDKICTHSGREKVLRNDTYNGKQRYICSVCNKNFTEFPYSETYR